MESFLELLDEELRRVLSLSRQRKIELRLIGAMAIRSHCSKYRYMLDQMKRELTDIDFFGLRRQSGEVRKLFADLSFEVDKAALVIYEGDRLFFKKHKIKADVFMDKLSMCHTIDLRDRFHLDWPTISLSDLLLEKMQIVQINEKDVKDTLILLLEHEVAQDELREAVNAQYITNLLSNDWGFCHTVTTNLKKAVDYLPQFGGVMNETQMEVTKARIESLLSAIENRPKSLRWKMRARIGTKKRWYTQVEEV